ncbi:sulfite exporter TauE/SafE family protein [Burkholderia ambifaria]|uniref:sulfite exporter TauE/SafE family protein n=1 Tax=Burkholderia ambifaria TaxID=152480 RepID=UPI0013FE3EFF|nr:sulfite exporter TauE/SafE family protein [Burkholderia ambifaria]NHL65987.1 sulfite exporter TauE/SafE family protein [Burkholderia ambifaria]
MLNNHLIVTTLLFVLGLFTGFIGTNTGGSAFLTVPIMIWLGISPQSAIASARVASVGTMVAGLREFHRQGKIDYKLALPAAILGLMGSVAGAAILIKIDANILHKLIGGLTLIMVALSLTKKPKPHGQAISSVRAAAGYGLFIFIGMVGGFFGGQAKLATYVFILIFNKTVSESVGTRKISGLVISLGSLAVYGVSQIINWRFGLSLVAGTLIGSTLGARYALKMGDEWMEKLLNIVVVMLALRLILIPT